MDQELYEPQNSGSYQDNKNSNEETRIKQFKIQLTPSQLAYLSKLLPNLYSFQLSNKSTIRNPSSQKNIKQSTQISLDKKRSAKVRVEQFKVESKGKSAANKMNNVRRKKSEDEEEEESVVYQKYIVQKQFSRNNSYDGIGQSLRPCIKILNQLKNSKTSWPFREPVDPVALGIPHYTQIIKQPMDLSTIQTNLKTNQYLTPNQFHADVSKIITNSYTFNASDVEFKKITAQFEMYYRKITNVQPASSILRANSQIEIPLDINNSKSSQKKIKKENEKVTQRPQSIATTISMSEKKELGMNIKKLARQHMKGILDIVNEGKPKSVVEFDLKQLDPQVIRKLQNYVKDKIGEEGKSKQVHGRQKTKQNKQRQESSFEIDQQYQS